MKTKIELLLIAFSFFLFANEMFAYSFSYSGIRYTIVSEIDQTVEVAANYQSSGSDGPSLYKGNIVIPSTVNYSGKDYYVIGIGYSAFVNCAGITSVSLPNTLKYISDQAFENCGSLSRITIPKNVESIGYDVFGVTSISEITVLSSTPATVSYNAFHYPQSYNNCVLYVPYGSKEMYQNASEWKKFSSIIENEKEPDTLSGHEYVDLGLPSGKLWATMNYGASRPEDYGTYVNWSSNDIISSTWGNNWITPTLADIKELESNCSWIWETRNGVNGYTVKGKNGNTIFLPAAGVKIGKITRVGEWVYYWTSTIDTEYADMAYIILTTATDVHWGGLNTSISQIPIRPVSKEGNVVQPTTYTFSVSATGNGSASYDGSTVRNRTTSFTVNEGTNATIIFSPDNGYRIKTVKVNNTAVTVSNNKYTLSNIRQNTTVEVEFEAIPPTTYTLSVTATGNGSASYNGTTIRGRTASFTVNEGTNATITFSPENGYRIKSVMVNNLTVSVSNNQYTVSNISRNTTVSVEFEAIPVTTYTLTVTATGSGSASYSGTSIRAKTSSFIVNEGTKAMITFTPDAGYRIRSLKVDGVEVSVNNNQYTTGSIRSNTTVAVEFEVDKDGFLSGEVADGTDMTRYITNPGFDDDADINSGKAEGWTIDSGTGSIITRGPLGEGNKTLMEGALGYMNYCFEAWHRYNWDVWQEIENLPKGMYELNVQGYVRCEVSGYQRGDDINPDYPSPIYLYMNSAKVQFPSVYSESPADYGNEMVQVEDWYQESINDKPYPNSMGSVAQCFGWGMYKMSAYGLIAKKGDKFRIGVKMEGNQDWWCIWDSFKLTYRKPTVDIVKPILEEELAKLDATQGVGSEIIESLTKVRDDAQAALASNDGDQMFDALMAVYEISDKICSLSISVVGNGSASFNGTTIHEWAGSFAVKEGTNAILLFTPDYGYRIKSVKVNGIIVTVSNNQYTVSNITKNTSVEVEFEAIPVTTYTLTVTATGSGSASYSGTTVRGRTTSFTVNEGTNATITFIPDNGYRIKTVKVNNAAVAVSNNQYTVSSISRNTTVNVEFEVIPPTTYTLSLTATGYGSASYNGTTVRSRTASFSVNEGTNATITFSPDNGYRVKSVMVNNLTVSVSNNQYTVSNISRNTTVSVEFEAIPPTTYTLSITATGYGSASYNGTTVRGRTASFTVNEGTNVTITFSPDAGYRVNTVTINNNQYTITDNQYTIAGISQNTTLEVVFEAAITEMAVNGVSYRVASLDSWTINVASGNYGEVLRVPATVSYEGLTFMVAGIETGALASATNLAAVIWEPTAKFTESVSNPNLLLYVSRADYAPAGIQNVVVNGTAERIVLTEASNGNDFYCPEEFTARSISLTHHYSMTSGLESCQGWETIVLPFDVQRISHESKGAMVPFAAWQQTDEAKPFWLYALGSGGWEAAATIRAYEPYIISVPNNDRYRDIYRLNGNVTFAAENVRVKKTDVATAVSGGGKTLVPNFRSQSASSEVFALNVVNDYNSETAGAAAGSQFVRQLRSVHPFEAYLIANNMTRGDVIPVFEEYSTTNVVDNEIMRNVENEEWYSVDGRKLEGKPTRKGVYIKNRKTVVVK